MAGTTLCFRLRPALAKLRVFDQVGLTSFGESELDTIATSTDSYA